jgi:hypothetical protein
LKISPALTACFILSATVTAASAQPLDGIALAQVTGTVSGNTATVSGPISRSNIIENDFDGALGVSIVQQNNGDNNLINAAVSVADMSETVPAFASSTTSVNTSVSGNTSSFSGGSIVLSNVISGAFNGASGVMVVQQNNGNNNAISAAVSVSGNGNLGILLNKP